MSNKPLRMVGFEVSRKEDIGRINEVTRRFIDSARWAGSVEENQNVDDDASSEALILKKYLDNLEGDKDYFKIIHDMIEGDLNFKEFSTRKGSNVVAIDFTYGNVVTNIAILNNSLLMVGWKSGIENFPAGFDDNNIHHKWQDFIIAIIKDYNYETLFTLLSDEERIKGTEGIEIVCKFVSIQSHTSGYIPPQKDEKRIYLSVGVAQTKEKRLVAQIAFTPPVRKEDREDYKMVNRMTERKPSGRASRRGTQS